MIWLTWRQFRGQALAAVAALAVLTIYLVILGLRIRHAYEVNVDCSGCSLDSAQQTFQNAYQATLLLGGLLVLAAPALIGAFWGAPLIAREVEAGTHRLVWNQSVSRTRWLAVKLGFVTLAGMAVTGALSLLLTWAASPYDKLFGQRFEPLTFPTRNIAPLGYAAFAVVAGTTIGLLTRRTVLAMAITLGAFVALQILMPTVIRPHLQPPVTKTVTFTADVARDAHDMGLMRTGVHIGGYTPPGAWALSPGAFLVDSAGNQVSGEQVRKCFTGTRDKDMACLTAQNLHFDISYQPPGRYWTFQWLEFAGYLLLAGLLAGFLFWRIPRGVS